MAMARATPEQHMMIVDRQRQVLTLVARGRTFRQIAAELGISVSQAHRDYEAGLRATLQQPADELRAKEMAVIEVVLEEALRIFLEAGNLNQRIRVLPGLTSVLERRAKLLGLDAPERRMVEVVSDEAIQAEIRRLTQLAGLREDISITELVGILNRRNQAIPVELLDGIERHSEVESERGEEKH
jgi:cytidylate kinase